MKARVLITLAISLFLSVGLYAQKGNIVVYSNISLDNEKREYIAYDKHEKQAISKVVYLLDENGNRKERIFSLWNSEKGWLVVQKHVYNYDGAELANIVYTKWDAKLNNWSASSEYVAPFYSYDGAQLAIKDAKDN